MNANKHYTMFTEKQTQQIEQIFNTDCYESRWKEKKNEVKGNGGFVFNT